MQLGQNNENTSDLIFYRHIVSRPAQTLEFSELPAVYLLLQGTAELSLTSETYVMRPSDMILVNSCELLSFRLDQAILCKYTLNLPLFKQKLGCEIPERFRCCCIGWPWKKKAAHLRALLAEYTINIFGGTSRLERQLLAMEIFRVLTAQFKNRPEADDRHINVSAGGYISRALAYMQSHFRESVRLEDIAHHCYISVSYLSKIFKEGLNVSIFSILNRIRLMAAREKLMYTREPAEKIALECGFPNGRALTAAFRREYGQYPSQYRKESPKENIYSSETSAAIKRLLSEYIYPDAMAARELCQSVDVHIDFYGQGKRLHHSLWNLFFVGDVRHISINGVKNMLPEVQKTFHYKYAYVSGLLTDTMLQLKGTSDIGARMTFIHVDDILETLIDNGLIPCIDLGCINPEIQHVDDLTKEFMEHLENTWGIDQLKQWMFIPGSCPINFFGPGSGYLPLKYENFLRIVKVIKAVSPEIQVGTPLVQLGKQENVWQWLTDYIDFCQMQECFPDFFSVIYYPLGDMLQKDEQDFLIQDPVHVSMSQMLWRLKSQVLSGENRPIFILEWNTSVSHRDFINDSIFKAAAIFKNMLENYDLAESFAFSMFFDGLEMFPASSYPIHGGRGMIASNGIKKPALWALYLLSLMGNEFIGRGDGYFITRKKDHLQIFLYYDVLGEQLLEADTGSSIRVVNIVNSVPVGKDGHPASALETVNSLTESKPGEKKWNIVLDNTGDGPLNIRSRHITREQCDFLKAAFDKKFPCPGGKLLVYWNAMTTPKLYSDTLPGEISEENGQCTAMNLSFALAPGEIALIEIGRSL